MTEAVDCAGADAAGGGAAGDDDRVDAMEAQQRGEDGFVDAGGHALVDEGVVGVDGQAVVEGCASARVPQTLQSSPEGE